MADDHRRAAVLAHELAEDVVDLVGRRSVELARRLVREEHARAMRERGAERDALLLAARQLGRTPVALRRETDTLEQLVGAAQPLLAGRAAQAELQRDEPPRRELRRERARVVLVGVAEHRRAVAREPARRQLPELLAVDAHRARRRPLEPGKEPQQRRLARAARAEHGEHLAVGDAQREPLQRRGVALRRRMHAEDVAELDRGRAHAAASAAREGARPRKSVAAPTSSTAATT